MPKREEDSNDWEKDVIFDNVAFVADEIFKVEQNGHKYNIGDVKTLIGLETCSRFNGEKVTITAFREDGEFCKAFYVKGSINEVLNWVYEYRLV
jgi:hypothetical protein